ncbi:hypothetical protein BDR05DRAFT_965176 [Suillus weaverae]|nr:hypothetical protein BDR05DRAFT_965176 [Suillus weaverae]
MRHQQKALNLRSIVALFPSMSRPRPQASSAPWNRSDSYDSTRVVAVPSPFKWDVKDSEVSMALGMHTFHIVMQVWSWIDFCLFRSAEYWSMVQIIAWTCLTMEIRQTARKFSLAEHRR